MRKLALLAATAALVLAGCTPGTAPGPSAPAASTSVPTTTPSPTSTGVPLGKVYDLPADRDTFQWGQPLGSLVGKKLSRPDLPSREGWRVDLMGVYRLGDDRVLAEFRLNAARADQAVRDNMMVWSDPDYSWWFHKMDRRNGGFTGAVAEFSDVKLTVRGDDASYRAVRTPTNYCLCSMYSLAMPGAGDIPAYAVLSTPKGATSVNLAIRDVGTFSGVAVTPAPPERPVVPLGFGYQLRLQAVSRPSAGVVRLRFSVEAPAAGITGSTFGFRPLYVLDGGGPWNSAAFATAGQFQNLIALEPAGVHGGWPKITDDRCDSCTKAEGQVVQPGTAVDLENDVPDPGSQDVLVATTTGWMFSARAADGTPTAADGLVRYRWQQVTTGATIGDDGVSLDSAVLFHVDSAKLTPKANGILDRTAAVLKAQDKRTVQIVGHADSTGGAAHNLDLSRRRAQAVKDALARRLGAGWTFGVEGRGETDPQVVETGLSGAQLERARALNRRVEVGVK